MGSVVDRPPDGGDHVLGHLQRVFGIENPRGGARRLAARIDEIIHLVRGGDPRRLFDDDEDDDEGTQMYDTDDLDYDDEDNGYDKKSKKRGRYADDDETSEDDVMAERIIHLAPPITAIACALIVALSLVYHFVLA